MANNVPDSITQYPGFDSVTAEGEANHAARLKAADVVRNQTVGVYDDRDGSVVQMPRDQAAELEGMGYTVGDREAETKAIYNEPGAQADAYAHHTANAVTLGTYDNVARAMGATDYLESEHKITEENPYSSLAGDLTGGAASAPARGFSPIGVGLAAYEGGSNAYNESAALKEPITSERVLAGAGWGVFYNGLFNLGPAAASKFARGAGQGLRAGNKALGIWKTAGEAAERAGAVEGTIAPKRIFQEHLTEMAKDDISHFDLPDHLELAPDDGKAGFHRVGYNAPTGTFDAGVGEGPAYPDKMELQDTSLSSIDRQPYNGNIEQVPKAPESGPDFGDLKLEDSTPGGEVRRGTDTFRDEYADKPASKDAPSNETAAQKMGKAIKGRDPVKIQEEFHANQKAQNKALIELDGLDHESSAAKKIMKALEKHDAISEKLTAEMAGEGAQLESAVKREASPEATPASDFDYGPAKNKKQKIGLWRRSYRAMLGDEGEKLDAVRQEFGKKGAQAAAAGDDALASEFFEKKHQVAKQMHDMFPDTVNPDTGAVKPGFEKHIREHARLKGNVMADLPDLKYRAMTKAEKADLVQEMAAHENSRAEYRGDEPSEVRLDGNDRIPTHLPNDLGDSAYGHNSVNFEGEKPLAQDLTGVNRVADIPRQSFHQTMDPSGEYLGPKVDRPVPEGPPRYSLKDEPKPPGDPEKISDINGKTLEEANAEYHASEAAKAAKSGGKKVKGDPNRIVRRFNRGSYWRAHFVLPPGLKHLASVGAAIDEIGPFVLNNTDKFAQSIQKIADTSAVGTGRAIKTALLARSSIAATKRMDVDKEWRQNQAMVLAAQASPQTLELAVRQGLGPGADQHPEFVANTVATVSRGVNALANGMPLSPQAPTPRGGTFDPPRSVKVRFNRMARAIANPDYAIAHPDPDVWAAVIATHPETAHYVQETLRAVVANPKIKLNKQQARNVSVLLQGAVTPQNQPEYLKSLHDAATLMNAANPPGKPGGSSGPKSAKTGQQVLSLDATPEQQAQLGL